MLEYEAEYYNFNNSWYEKRPNTIKILKEADYSEIIEYYRDHGKTKVPAATTSPAVSRAKG
jgi:hypothetical protein